MSDDMQVPLFFTLLDSFLGTLFPHLPSKVMIRRYMQIWMIFDPPLLGGSHHVRCMVRQNELLWLFVDGKRGCFANRY